MHNIVEILGLPIHNVRLPDVMRAIDNSLLDRKPLLICPINVDVVMKSRNHARFYEALMRAQFRIADGVPLLWASVFLGKRLKEKISGSDFFLELCRKAAVEGLRLFFLGGGPGVAEEAAFRLRQKWPDLKVAACYSPPSGFENDLAENARIVKAIDNADPDILVVGLGAPKQELWLDAHAGFIRVPIRLTVGGTFDFASGRIARSPQWMSRVGFEWLWRLLQEPRRLWKRYLVEDMPFFYYVLKQKISRKNHFTIRS